MNYILRKVSYGKYNIFFSGSSFVYQSKKGDL